MKNARETVAWRELTHDEIEVVSGGEIVVRGNLGAGGLSGIGSSYSSNREVYGLGRYDFDSPYLGDDSSLYGPLVATDGDGIPDSPEIVVRAPSAPTGYHFNQMDPHGAYYMSPDSAPNVLVLTPWAAARAAEYKDKLDKSMAQLGVVDFGIGLIPGAGPFANVVGGILTFLGLGSAYSPVPQAPTR